MQKHNIPVHLETQDKLVFGLTTRQLMVIALGVTLTYSIWSSFPSNSLLEILVSLSLAAIPTLFSFLVAFIRPSGQGLDDWLIIWFFFVISPKTMLWEPLVSLDDEIELEHHDEHLLLEEDD